MAGVVNRLITQAAASTSVIAFVVALALPGVTLHEGMETKAYLDPVGIPTICVGHTEGVVLGQVRTVKECEQFAKEDLTKAAIQVDRLVKVPMTPYEHAAYASFVFNVGQGTFARSTMLRLLNSGDHVGACAQLSRFIYAKKIKLAGLIKRRAYERAQCETGLTIKK